MTSAHDIVRILRHEITDLQPGDLIPSTAQLVTRFGVAPMTVASAVRTLKSEGLVQGHQGRGVTVLPRDAHDPVETRKTRLRVLAHLTGPFDPDTGYLDRGTSNDLTNQLNDTLIEDFPALDVDPLLHAITTTSATLRANEHRLRLLMAYARERTTPAYPRSQLARAADMSTSHVRQAYDVDDLVQVDRCLNAIPD